MTGYLVKKPKGNMLVKKPGNLDEVIKKTTKKTLKKGKPATSEDIVKNIL